MEFIKICYYDHKKKYSDISLDVFFYDETNPNKRIMRGFQNTIKKWIYYTRRYKVSKERKGALYIPKNKTKRAMLQLLCKMKYSHLLPRIQI